MVSMTKQNSGVSICNPVGQQPVQDGTSDLVAEQEKLWILSCRRNQVIFAGSG